jgi:hypothetical protein
MPTWRAAEAAVELVHGVSHCREASERSIGMPQPRDRAGIGEPEGHSSSRSPTGVGIGLPALSLQKRRETPRLTCDLSQE